MAALRRKILSCGTIWPILSRSIPRQSQNNAQIVQLQKIQPFSTRSGAHISREGKRRLLIFAVGAFSGFASVPLVKKYFIKDDVVPKVDAAQRDDDDIHGVRRSTMNFIADVVEIASPAVVCIEIEGRSVK